MEKTLGILAVLSLLATPIAAGAAGLGDAASGQQGQGRVVKAQADVATSSPSQLQEDRCLTPDLLIARARSERPSTEILARHTGPEAAALIDAMNTLDAEDGDETPMADEVTVLRSARSDEVLLFGAEEGCLVWRGETSLPEYQHALWKAFGLPV
jgi:hypothetical protein